MKSMNRISVDNGNTFVSPKEAIQTVGVDVILNSINTETANAAHNEAPETDLEWLEIVLTLTDDDLIIG